MNDIWSDHVFAVTAYKESPFLGDCLDSLMAQTVHSRVIITTATPNAHIEEQASKYSVPLVVNPGAPGIGSDWNFAVATANAPFVTIAHQDDTYCPNYAEHARLLLEASKHPLIFFSNYGELRDSKQVDDNRLLSTKRKMLAPLKSGRFAGSQFVRRRILSLGSAICCPSVTLACRNLPDPIFIAGMKSNLDWDAWARIADYQGDFLYDDAILMYHRIHKGSETTAIIEDGERGQEDFEMFRRFWPAPIAHAINRIYSQGEKSNNVS